ncbi:hypothetical protein [Mucilaginibacter sp.]|uniref:hypothetical protein n=1 Tax=Mucilaginibacter sp. TaxID=1882438 RepID=UPI0026384381|nr:hypothetical protein [Mucilaginibacter sp.]MDB4919484.1 hypothetical protein [Mucilaginibacter sp.]
MDRTLKIYTKTEHLFAEFTFHYDHPGRASGHYTQYRRLYNDDEEDESKSVFPLMQMDLYPQFRQFESIDQIKAHDVELAKNELGRDMTDPRGYTYVYDPTPVLLRYVVENHRGCIGMINVLFSFIDNTKEVKFLSATNPRYDFDISSNSLETNVSCIVRIPWYTDRDVREISSHDLKRLEPWY